MTRKEQAKQTHDRILKVCEKLLTQYTFDEINISQICDMANISVGAFYHHFPSKDSIIIEIYRNVDQTFFEEILPSLQNQPAYDSIVQYLVLMGQYAQRLGVDLITNIYKAQINHGNDFFLSYQRGLPKGLYQLIHKALDSHELNSDTNPEILMKDLLTLTRGIVYHWCVCGGSTDIQEHIRRMATTYLYAYKNIINQL